MAARADWSNVPAALDHEVAEIASSDYEIHLRESGNLRGLATEVWSE